MNFDDDLPVFLADFGVLATVGSVTHKVLFNKPDATIFDGGQVTSDYQMRYVASDFPALHNGQAITVDGVNYHIKGEPMAMSDGKFKQADLKK